MKVTLESLSDDVYDYIVIGGGTSGCLIAARLAAAQHGVLLVEAGGDIEDDTDNLIPGLTFTKFGSTDGNWLYPTVPQQGLGEREILYPRGLGMGGCSANNFMAWVRGPKVDFDDWAEKVGDSWWKWENVLEVLKDLEDFRPQCPLGDEELAKPTAGAHGNAGPIAVGFGKVWQPVIKHCLAAGKEAGHAANADHNDGDPIGVSVAQFNVGNGIRLTSATAFVSQEARSRLKNLTVVTRALCAKILFQSKRANGVELLPAKKDGLDMRKSVHAKREVIVSAGAFESPHILLLSGIGPAAQIDSFGIPLIQDLPAVGRNMQDHTALTVELEIDPSISTQNQLYKSPEALKAAHEQYNTSKTGPLAVFGASAGVIFPRSERIFSSHEFAALPLETQAFLSAPGRPTTEVWMHGGPLFFTGHTEPDASVIAIEGLCQNNLSRGALSLASADPRELPSLDPRYLSHPYDRRIAIETVRDVLDVVNAPSLREITRKILHGPRSTQYPERSADPSDEEALDRFVTEELTMGFHAMSTCVMGKEEEENKVVSNEFKVVGVEGLRVACMSVCPLLTTNHTQINAYLIGIRCAELILNKGQGFTDVVA